MKLAAYSRSGRTVRFLLGTLVACALLAFGTLMTPRRAAMQTVSAPVAVPESTTAMFSNPDDILCGDRSNTPGSMPGVPPINYPSSIVVSGLTGTIAKVRVGFRVTSTFPADLDVLLIGPTGAKTLLMSDAGGTGTMDGVAFNWDQTAANFMPASSASPIPPGDYKPSNYAGAPVFEPGGADNFPAPGPGQLNYAADLNVFNGTNPNGTWSLFVVDDEPIDFSSLPGGWTLEITLGPAGCTTAKRPLDFNGDGRTDFTVVRGGSQLTWFTLINGGGSTATSWGLGLDYFAPADFDGDGKTDIAVWRPGAQSFFFILQSATGTLRSVPWGSTTDDPRMTGDYDGDGKADPAVYRPGQGAIPSAWYYLSSVNGQLQTTNWGQQGDVPVPGDFDGDAKYDFAVQRKIGSQAVFFRKFSGGGSDAFAFGLFDQDDVVPGYYDADCKQDIAVIRASLQDVPISWFILNSSNQTITSLQFGVGGNDYSTQGDYDGDGRTDVSVWRHNAPPDQTTFFYFIRSSDNTLGVVPWGLPNDFPAALFNTH